MNREKIRRSGPRIITENKVYIKLPNGKLIDLKSWNGKRNTQRKPRTSK